uniref:Uncharacterized protein n=1 Tax=Romanomermis culicivorax TaxID=13658 RepID=A0A915JYP2_ROMCU
MEWNGMQSTECNRRKGNISFCSTRLGVIVGRFPQNSWYPFRPEVDFREVDNSFHSVPAEKAICKLYIQQISGYHKGCIYSGLASPWFCPGFAWVNGQSRASAKQQAQHIAHRAIKQQSPVDGPWFWGCCCLMTLRRNN